MKTSRIAGSRDQARMLLRRLKDFRRQYRAAIQAMIETKTSPRWVLERERSEAFEAEYGIGEVRKFTVEQAAARRMFIRMAGSA